MDEDAGEEILELDSDHFIAVEITREWPRYVATWSIRRQTGETDFPVKSGRIERMPPKDPAELDQMLDDMRAEARAVARTAAGEAVGAGREVKSSSFLGRLFGRR